MQSWIKRNRWESLIIAAIILLALFMRFYGISGYMTFLGDEGRDALVIKGILVNHHIPLLGPPSSVGNIYLGPLYYYMMAIPMAIFYLNPVAAAGMDAVIGVATVCLIYFLARQWFGKEGAVVASLLYAISPITIIYSRSSWNPNPAPFFALLSLLSLYLARSKKDYRWLALTGASLAAAVQMHYLSLILLPVYGILWLYELSLLKRQKRIGKFFGLGTVLAVVAFILVMSPLAAFDFRHQFVNFKAMKLLLSGKNSGVSFSPFASLTHIIPTYNNVLVHDYLSGGLPFVTELVSVTILVPLVWSVVQKIKGKAFQWSFVSLGIWLIVGLIGVSFYQNQVYDHYLAFLNPAPYLLLAGLFYFLQPKLRLPVAIILLVILVPANLMKSPLQYPPNNQLQRTQEIAHFIIEQANNQPFNFALLSAHNYDSAYQFYLGRFGHTPLKVPENRTSQLFVVCEDPVCQPINNPKYEIAGFGYAKIAEVSNFDGVKVYKLVANPGGKPQ